MSSILCQRAFRRALNITLSAAIRIRLRGVAERAPCCGAAARAAACEVLRAAVAVQRVLRACVPARLMPACLILQRHARCRAQRLLRCRRHYVILLMPAISPPPRHGACRLRRYVTRSSLLIAFDCRATRRRCRCYFYMISPATFSPAGFSA